MGKKKSIKFANFILIMAVITGGGRGKQFSDDIITVAVTKSYPKKELIHQDFLNVEYILLDDTNDDFITKDRRKRSL